jgi:hypothetical protein
MSTRTRVLTGTLWAALLCLAGSTPPAHAQPPLTAYLDSLCRLPRRANEDRVLDLTGVDGYSTSSMDELAALFPAEHDGRPQTAVALGVREPGLVITFPAPMQAWMFLIAAPPGLTVTPPELAIGGAEITSAVIAWDPWPGRPWWWGERTAFGPGCFFEIIVPAQTTALGRATVNLVALYGGPGDTVELWGTEVGLADVLLEETREAYYVPVSPTTWGRVKALFHE